MQDISFERQVAIVTGAGRSLGRDYALDLARRGASVVVADVGGLGSGAGAWADHVVAEITAAGGRALACYDSVATSEGADAILEAARRAYGHVDILVHNAGFLRPGMLENLSDTQWREILDVHLAAAFFLARSAWGPMKVQGYGRIVLTSSSAVFGFEGGANYGAAKAGILGLTTALAEEGARHGIRVNAILPYAISDIAVDNPMPEGEARRHRTVLSAMDSRRHSRSVSPIVAYLASRACTVTGQAYSALAGRYARVAFTVGGGWVGDPNEVTAEDIRDHLPEIDDLTTGFSPQNMAGEIDSVYADLQRKGLL